MARILVHALAATAGGGANYLRNFLARVGVRGAMHEWLVMAPSELEGVADSPHVRIQRGGAGRSCQARSPWIASRLPASAASQEGR